MNFHDTAQYTRVVADLGKGPWGTPHNCGKKSKEAANIMVMLPQYHCQFILISRVRGRKAQGQIQTPQMPLSFLSVFSLQLAFHDLYSVFHFVNPLTPEAFCPKCIFWTFWRFSGWLLAKLALIQSKGHLQHDSLPFFSLALCFTTFWLGHAQK